MTKKICFKLSTLAAGLIVIVSFSSCTPNPEQIFRKSFMKCQSIENGYYEMTQSLKFMYRTDTVSSSFNCFFQKLPNDSIFSSAFHYQQFINSEYLRDALYTGDEFVNYWLNDSTGEVMSKALWAKEIKSFSHNYTFYSPITNRKSYPLPNHLDLKDDKSSFQYIGEEMVNDSYCYHSRVKTSPEIDTLNILKVIGIEKNFWINKFDLIPIQYSIKVTLVEYQDTLVEFFLYTLDKYELNNLKNKNPLKLSSIPNYINLVDYTPHKRPDLLPNNTTAPDWSLLSLNNETISLSALKGNLVLLDFFYKSCHPCMLALPTLQRLHEKYENKGLQIIGIDPYDTKEKDDIDNFLSSRGVTYKILLGGKDIAKAYYVSGYPTIYLIDKEGKILSAHVGFGERTEAILEKLITENLSFN